MTDQQSLFGHQVNTAQLRKPITKPLSYWRDKFVRKGLAKDYLPISRSLGVSPYDPISELVAETFTVHGRCPECGWFGGHCSHTAVLGPDGRYHAP